MSTQKVSLDMLQQEVIDAIEDGPGAAVWGSITGDITDQADLQSALAAAGGGDWGDIGGTLSDQTDLQAALDAKQALDPDLTSWAAVARGTGFDAAAAVNVGSAGAFVTNGGTLGTPSGGTLTNCTGLPVASGISGLGTGVATALSVNSGGAGSFLINGGVIGTPSGGTINLGSVSISGTVAQFNSALSDGDFATLAGSEALTNKAIDGQSNTLTKIPVTYSNSSDFTTTSTTFVNATDLAFPVLANKKYAVCYYLLTNKTDANGLQTQFTGPASPTKINLRHASSTSALTSLVTEFLTAFSQASSTVNTVNGDGIVTNLAGGMISNGANAGTVQLQLRAVTGGTAKIYAGSWIQVTQLD